ncbi:MAG: PTS sugar transporter subunit IIA [Gemmatimonadetes bacterium]|nr:PTS sugar transporter subunit IIA [Gemmatimonadota bacterium]
MKLSEVLTPERIRIPLASSSKEAVLRELVSLLPGRDSTERETILEAVLEREGRMSTGIGQGVAIPHGKTGVVKGMEMAFGIASEPIDYGALDGEPVDVFFLLLSPPDLTAPHIKMLAGISRMLSSDTFRDELAAAVDAEDVLVLFRREEALADED